MQLPLVSIQPNFLLDDATPPAAPTWQHSLHQCCQASPSHFL